MAASGEPSPKSAPLPDPATAVTQALAPPPADARRFHHYEVALRPDGVSLDELGRGAMGVTYRARDVNLDTPVALKVIGPALSDHPGARERFRREARAAAQLRHPNVASVFHFGQTDAGQCFYAMEFIPGETLADRVSRDGPLPAPLVVEIALQINAALVAADRRGLVHRDLKPGNLMLVAPEEGTGGTSRPGGSSAGQVLVKVIDFGLAKAITSASAGPADAPDPLTQGEFLGTPQFAAPEQAEGGEVDARSDIYSLGATLWYLLTARVPFAGRSLGEIHDRQLHRPLPVGQLADARVPAPLVALLESMLAAEPAHRPASPLALEEALERVRQEIGGTAALRQVHRASRPAASPARWQRLALPAAVLAALGLLGFLVFQRSRQPAAPPPTDRSIAVLPLENLSDDKDNAFFADGIQDDVLASLAKLKELKVISRASVASYKAGAPRNLREIGAALDVANVLTGSVRRAGNRVLVNVELVNAANGRQLWAERYDRTLADSLTLQGELATEIAAALRATLTPSERAQMAARPTEDADAYLLYLRGREAQTATAGLLEDYQRAARLYEQAIAHDPAFALARARLSATLAYLYQQYQPTAANRDRARAEAEAALRLRPDLGEGHLARALCLYWLDRDYPAALSELEVARRLLPNDSDVDATAAYITRRQGRWTDARDAFHRILARDPRNGQLAEELCFTDVRLRDWPAAERSGDLAVTLAPDSPAVVIYRRYIDFWRTGNVAPLKAALAAFPPGVDPDGAVTYARWDVALTEHDYPAAERAVADCTLDALPISLGPPLPKAYLLGCVALARGDTVRARALFQTVLPAFESEARTLPHAFRFARLGLVYAYLGRREDALRAGRRAVELLPEDRDALDGPQAASFLALILTWCGETDAALALVDHLLRTPGSPDSYEASITLADLRAHWQWDPLRADPRFQKILTGPKIETVFQ